MLHATNDWRAEICCPVCTLGLVIVTFYDYSAPGESEFGSSCKCHLSPLVDLEAYESRVRELAYEEEEHPDV